MGILVFVLFRYDSHVNLNLTSRKEFMSIHMNNSFSMNECDEYE